MFTVKDGLKVGSVQVINAAGEVLTQAASANKLSSSRTITIDGDVIGELITDFASNSSLSLALNDAATNTGMFGNASTIPQITVDAKGRVTAVSAFPVALSWSQITNKPLGLQDETTGPVLTLTDDLITLTAPLGVGDEGIQWLGGNGWKVYESPDGGITPGSGDLQFMQSTARRMTLTTGGSLLVGNGVVWTSENGGALSGLDADLLDGEQGSFYTNASNLSAGTIPGTRLPEFTGDVTKMAGSSALILASVNPNNGVWGSGSEVPVLTVNAKGLVVAVGTATVAPAWSSIINKPTTRAGYGITDVQPLDPTLSGLANVTTSPNTLLYATGSDIFAATPFTSFARTLLTSATAAEMRTVLGVGGSTPTMLALLESYGEANWTGSGTQVPTLTAANTVVLRDIGSDPTNLLDRQTADVLYAQHGDLDSFDADYLDGQHGSFYQNATNLNAGIFSAARLPSFSGDVASTVGSSVLTLASVNANVGMFGNATHVGILTLNNKGLVTSATSALITPAWASITSKPTTLSGFGITDAVSASTTQNIGGDKTFTANVVVNGSLTILGDTMIVNTINLEVADAVITVGKNNVGTVPWLGVKVERGSADAFMVWDEANDRFAVYTSGNDMVDGGTAAPFMASRFVSTVATGTSPLVVTSTTAVTNLNADLLDGQHGVFYQNATSLTAGTLSDARLSTNVPLKTSNATISGFYTITKPFTSTNDLNADGANLVVNTITKSPTLMAYDVQRNGVSVGGITLSGVGVFSNATVAGGVVWHSANDGAESGLDADLLDGQQSLFYQNAANLNAGTLLVARTPAYTGDVSKAAGLDVLTLATVNGSVGVFGNATYVPQITVNAKGLITSVASMQIAGNGGSGGPVTWANVTDKPTTILGFGITDAVPLNSPVFTGTPQAPTPANATNNTQLATTAFVKNVMASADADLLDGQHGSFYTNASNLNAGTVPVGRLPVSVWTTENDGAGTGLDADLLDGQHGTFYQNASNLNAGSVADLRLPSTMSAKTFNGTITSTVTGVPMGVSQISLAGANHNRIQWNNNGQAPPAYTNRSAGVKLLLRTALAANSVDYAIGTENDALWFSVPPTTQFRFYGGEAPALIINGSGDITLTANRTLNANSSALSGVGSLQLSSVGPASGITWSSGNGWSIFEAPDNLTNASGNLQITQGGVVKMTLGANGALVVGGGAVWTSGNDGAGSGLDADLLDGQHGAFYTNAANLTGVLANSALTGGAYSVGRILASDGSASLPSYSFASDADTGLYLSAAGVMTYQIDGQSRLSINNSGMNAAIAGGWYLYNRASTATSPSVVQNRNSPLTGIGGVSGEISLITSGTEIVKVTSTSMTVNRDTTFVTNVVVGGDFSVLGQTFVVNATNLEVADAIITVAKNNSTGVIPYAGLKAERGSAGSDAYLIWDEANDTFSVKLATDDAAIGAGTDALFSAARFISSVATGTAPLTVASTTVVSNLNADLLDGQQGSYYQNATNLTSGTLAVARTPAFSGDVAKTAGSATLTLATVNSNVGSFGNATYIPQITVDGKGRITAVSAVLANVGGGGSSYFKDPVTVATTGNIALATPGSTIDDITMINGDRVLVWMQNTVSQNGIYVFNGPAVPMTRATDADTWAELAGSVVVVLKGSEFGDDLFVCSSDTGGTLGTSPVTYINKTQPSGGFDSDPWDPLLAQGFGPVYATGTGVSQDITLPQPGHEPSNLFVTVNGVLRDPTSYSIVGTTLTITATNGSAVVVRCGGYKGEPGAAGTMSTPGNILFPLDNTYTIGLANSTSRPSYVHVGTEVRTPSLQIASTANSAVLSQPSAGALSVSTNRGSVGNEKFFTFGADGSFATVNGPVVSGTGLLSNGGDVTSKAAVYPYLQLNNTAASTNAKFWRFGLTTTGQFNLGLMNDAYNAETFALNVTRSGTAVGDWTFNGTSFVFKGPTTLMRGNAVTANNWISLMPTDYGAGKPGLFVSKSATASTWKIAVNDGSADGQLDISSAVTVNGTLDINGVTTANVVNLTGKATLVSSNTARASLNAPHGDAPSSPINGDIWTTTDGLFLRANGVTYGMERQGEAWGVNNQTASYVLALSDKGKIIEMNNAAANTLTVPPTSSVAFPLKTRIDIVQYGAGQTTIVAGAGVTIRAAGGRLKLTAQYSSASLYKRADNEWVLMGDLVL